MLKKLLQKLFPSQIEYRTDTIKILHDNDREELELFLNRLSSEGWKLFSIIQVSTGYLLVVSVKN